MQPPFSRILDCATAALALIFASLTAAASQPGTTPDLPPGIPSTARQYVVFLVGSVAGRQASWTTPDGALHIFFQYSDRGRGPATTSVLRLDASGVPIAESVTGNNYLKAPVDENYALASGSAHWQNEYEHGARHLTAPAIYVAMDPSPIETGVLAAAALQHGGQLALLPEGEAHASRVSDLTLESSGESKHITLYAVAGLDYSPEYVWLDDRAGFFASVSDWLSVLPDAWQSSLPALRTAQNQVVEARSADLARTLIHRPSGPVAITHVDLFDSATAAIVHDQTVILRGERIQSVGPAASATIPRGAELIDGRSRTLLPGLWDMHAHVADNDGLLNLAAGVTTVRDLANDIDTLLARRRRIENLQEVGTRIVLAGVIDGPGPYHGPTKVLVSTDAEGRAAVDNYKRLGYVQIKIYSSVPPTVVPAIIQEAHRLGMRVSGHIPADMYADQCVELGYNEIQHANFLMLNFMRDVRDTNTRSRFTAVAQRGAGLDLQSPAMQSFVQLLLAHHIDLDPTLDVFEDMYMQGPGAIPPAFQPVADRLPTQVRRQLLSSGLAAPPGMQETYRRSFRNMLAMIGMMYRAGIPIEDGTDEMPGFSLHRELELDVQAGLPPNRVLQDATLNAARIMSMDYELGSIVPGKLADLDLVTGDPVANMANVRNVVLTVKDGNLYYPAELDAALGIAPR
ncbi:MAG TPA: amidohydrolase family protein [Acidobacteriaceae bacterium]|nr:amidohydrolase family protein [Acidobacteriaceae bacterium]